MSQTQLNPTLDFRLIPLASTMTNLQIAHLRRLARSFPCTLVLVWIVTTSVVSQEPTVPEAPAGQQPAEISSAIIIQGDVAVPASMPPGSVPPNFDGSTPNPTPPTPNSDSKKENAPQSVETIRRPKEPKGPPDKTEFQVRPDEAGMVQFQFRDQSWPDVLQWLADVSGLALDWQELPGDLLSIATPGKTSLSETRDVINRHLLARGFTLLEFPGVLQVVKTKEINSALVPRVTPEELSLLPPNRFVRTTFKLDSLIAKELLEELKLLISTHGTLRALSNTNRLEAMDTAANLADISRILSEEQSDVVLNNLAREFPLEHVRASEVREQLVAFLKLDDGKGPKSAPNSGGNPELEAQQQQMLMLQQAQMAGQQPNAGGAPRPAATQADIRLVANNRRNSLIVNAPPDKMAIVAAFISRVDVTSPNEQYQALSTRMKVYRLASLEPKKFVGSLLALNVLEPTTRLEVDDKNKSMIAYASLADHLTIQETLKKLDGSARQVEVIQLRRLRAEEVAGTIRLLMGLDQEKKEESPRRGFYAFDFAPQPSKESTSKDQLRVGANVGNNQLILWANEFEAAEIKKLLTKLGEISPQGGSDQRIRVIEGNRSQQMREYLERLQQTWDAKGIELDIPSDSEFEVDFPSTDSAAPNTEKTDRKIKDGQKKAPKPFDDAPPLGAASAPENDMNGILVAVDQPPEGELTQENDKRNAGSLRSFPQSPPNPSHTKIKMRFDERGDLILESDDTNALDSLEEWMLVNAPPEKEYHIFHVRHSRPYWIRMNLEEYFKEDSSSKKNNNDSVFRWLFDLDPPKQEYDGPQLGKKRKLKIMSDSDTNTLLVSGASDSQLQTMQRLIDLWDKPTLPDKQSLRFTKSVKVEYSKAQNIVDAIKDAFRDLLSSNDKAMERKEEDRGQGSGRESKRKADESISDGGMNFEFTGKLSLGVDKITNTILVSAKGEDLLEMVCDLIEELDQKAKRSETIEVLKVNGTSTLALEKALKNLLRGKSANQQGGVNSLKLTPGAGGQIIPTQGLNPQGNGSSFRGGADGNSNAEGDFEN